VVTGDIEASLLAFGLAPLAAGAVGLLVVRGRLTGATRAALLLVSGALTLAGLPGYFAFNVAVLIAGIAVLAFVGGLLPNPRALFSKLDPRL